MSIPTFNTPLRKPIPPPDCFDVVAGFEPTLGDTFATALPIPTFHNKLILFYYT